MHSTGYPQDGTKSTVGSCSSPVRTAAGHLHASPRHCPFYASTSRKDWVPLETSQYVPSNADCYGNTQSSRAYRSRLRPISKFGIELVRSAASSVNYLIGLQSSAWASKRLFEYMQELQRMEPHCTRTATFQSKSELRLRILRNNQVFLWFDLRANLQSGVSAHEA